MSDVESTSSQPPKLLSPEHYSERLANLTKQKPYEFPAFQKALKRWFAANDRISLEFVPREQWDPDRCLTKIAIPRQQEEQETNPRPASYTLTLPEDLSIQELIGVFHKLIEATTGDYPQSRLSETEALKDLGKKLTAVGVYLAKHISDINVVAREQEEQKDTTNKVPKDRREAHVNRARQIAEIFAKKCYEFGLSLQTWQTHGDATLQEI